MTKQKGFTLIELIIVIVILGALAVVALPRFIDLQDEAQQSAAEGVAGAISSAFAINYAGSLTNTGEITTATGGQTVSIDGDAAHFDIQDIMQGDISDYEVEDGCDLPSTAGETEACELELAGPDELPGGPVPFTVIATEDET